MEFLGPFGNGIFISLFGVGAVGWGDDSVGEEACPEFRLLEFSPWDTHGRKESRFLQVVI